MFNKKSIYYRFRLHNAKRRKSSWTTKCFWKVVVLGDSLDMWINLQCCSFILFSFHSLFYSFQSCLDAWKEFPVTLRNISGCRREFSSILQTPDTSTFQWDLGYQGPWKLFAVVLFPENIRDKSESLTATLESFLFLIFKESFLTHSFPFLLT